MRLETCLLCSALLHALILLPGLSGWLSPFSPSPSPRLPTLRLQLRSPSSLPSRLAGQAQGELASPAAPGQLQSHSDRLPAPPPLAPSRPAPAAISRPASPPPIEKLGPIRQGYPVHHPGRIRQPSATPPAGLETGDSFLDPPVMIKGPLKIPIPPFLRNREGHFLMTLRCRVEKDGSTLVQVMEGTGAPDLDESVRQSFSGLPWYRAEQAGQPMAVTVRLTIEGSWESGQDSIDWGGRIPPMN
ncbi:MAG: hypothetical protein U0931_04625 [Vulcanimicrobiota bacterium]